MVRWWVQEELGKKIYWQNKKEVLWYLHTGLFLLNLYVFPNFSYIFFLGVTIIESQYFEGPVSPCTLITCCCFTYSFWNFDALFQPQQHPARDSHDTFYLKGLFHLIGWTIPSGFLLIFTCHSCIVPSTTKELPEDYVERVKRVHESGGYGSRGYGIFFVYLSSNIFWISLHNLFNESFKWCFCFSALAAMNMIGAERKQTKTFCVHTQQLCQPGCFTI